MTFYGIQAGAARCTTEGHLNLPTKPWRGVLFTNSYCTVYSASPAALVSSFDSFSVNWQQSRFNHHQTCRISLVINQAATWRPLAQFRASPVPCRTAKFTPCHATTDPTMTASNLIQLFFSAEMAAGNGRIYPGSEITQKGSENGRPLPVSPNSVTTGISWLFRHSPTSARTTSLATSTGVMPGGRSAPGPSSSYFWIVFFFSAAAFSWLSFEAADCDFLLTT